MEARQENARVTKRLETAVLLAQGAVEEVRRISRNLRPSQLSGWGIIKCWHDYCKKVADHGAIMELRGEKVAETYTSR